MAQCKNHIKTKAIYHCEVCSEPICSLCFNKTEYKEYKKRSGFCSALCRSEYLESIKTARKINRPIVISELVKGGILLLIATLLLFFVLWEVERGKSTTITKAIFLFLILIGSAGLFKFLNVMASYKSGFRNLRSKKKRFVDEIGELDNVTNPINVNECSDALIICTGISDEDLVSGINDFESIMGGGSNSKKCKVQIDLWKKDELTALTFNNSIHPYMFYNLLDYFDHSNSVGYITLLDQRYVLKNEISEDYLIAVNEKNEFFEISKVDGKIKPCSNSQHQFPDYKINLDMFAKVKQMEISLDEIGDFGRP